MSEVHMNSLMIAVDTQNKLAKRIEKSIRELRTNILTNEGKNKSILFTSTKRGEGKTTVSLQLALSLSRCEKKVVWMNCNFHGNNKMISFSNEDSAKKSFGGLAEYLNGTCNLEQIIYPVEDELLHMIPCGNSKMMSCDLFERESFQNLLTELEQDYDYIILDSSAASEYLDCKILAGKCDGIVYVIQYNKVSRVQIQRSVEQLRKCKGNIIGAVLNQSKPY